MEIWQTSCLAEVSYEYNFDDDQFWFSNGLYDLDWASVVKSNIPGLDASKVDIIRSVSALNHINPLITLGALKSNPAQFSFNNDQEFTATIYDWTKNLLNAFWRYENNHNNSTASTLALQSSLAVSYESFVDSYNNLIHQNYVEAANPFRSINNTVNGSSKVLKSRRFRFDPPFPKGKKYGVSGTHTNTGGGWGPHSSLDVWKFGSCRWNQKGCNARVAAAHSGKVEIISNCNVKITHKSGFSTQYYHMEGMNTRRNRRRLHRKYIRKGRTLGRYAKRRSVALCNGGTSSGPHLHFTLLSIRGTPISLDGKRMGNYRIKAGRKNYDKNCKRCYFRNIKSGKKYCPNDRRGLPFFKFNWI